MSRGGFKISRTADGDYEYASSSAAPRWLEEFAAKMDEKPTTAVEVARQRNSESTSFLDRINAIMGGNNAHRTSPYNSVEEAVKDYQKRTGLLDYQKLAMAQSIVDAGNAADDDSKKKDKPELLEKFPAIEHYIHNVINSQYGIQLPAIVHGILETFSRDVQASDIDSDLYHWINDVMKDRLGDQNYSNDFSLGRGVGTDPSLFQTQDGNRDPFINLMPARMANKK